MKKLVTVFLLIVFVSAAGFSQQRQLRPNAARTIEDAVLGFYISQFPEKVEVSDEVLAKILPMLRAFVRDRFEVSTRKIRALNQLQMMVQRGDSEDDIKKLIREIDRADTDLQAGQEKFLAGIDPLLNAQQQAKVRLFQAMTDQRLRQMIERVRNAAGNRPAVPSQP
jgi:hypothetical protein